MTESYIKTKSYIINLDLPAEERWNEIGKVYKKEIKQLLKYSQKIMGSMLSATKWTAWLFSNYVFYIDELKGLAKAAEVDLSELILAQLCYEMFSCCTSLVIATEDKDFHFRTMDWEMPELSDLTINIDFCKNDMVLYKATTWAAYIGVLTGVRKGIGSVSLNYRRTDNGSLFQNLKSMINGSWPSGFLIRHAFETATAHYELVEYLSNSKLISPCYMIVGGPTPRSGIIIVRDREEIKSKIVIGDEGYLVQTNIDYDDLNNPMAPNILYSKERIEKVSEIMQQNPNINDFTELLQNFGVYPIINYETIYVSLMDSITGQIDSWIVDHDI